MHSGAEANGASGCRESEQFRTVAADARKGFGHLLVAINANVSLDPAARLAVSQHIQQCGLQGARRGASDIL